ncbi:oxidoreductase [Amycolatopsis dendrobii]|uniref:SDR family NAD(P)-dependent oxidoreductase n=1 Tax=Amycolatopsis dendrobii TaxID=2760662 RepID=A0A7W3W1X4_9PSEU|nr:oxidoreductase [Amycolatopsis dendrobii]MBB1157336.1 SDR family NAD(P)-dependent oxidoreductase [Amycolatopsis dendrobii]
MNKWFRLEKGRVAVVTGANTGIGFETARALAHRGARVVLACRDPEKAKDAARRIGRETQVVRLDLASLDSVREAADEVRGRHDRIDLLINNAGVTNAPGRTADGFEMQFGVNHLGHFAWTALLLDRLLDVPGSRVVTVSSIAHRFGRIDPDDLKAASGYPASKLANLLFAYELAKRLRGTETVSLAAHPGGAATEIFRHSSAAFRGANLAIARLFGRTPAMGALPTLRAAADPAASNGEYYGPGGLFEIRGYPELVQSSARSHDADLQKRLWEASLRATGAGCPV